jgi:hypothetical protein
MPNTMTTATLPAGYIVWHKTNDRGSRWKKVATVRTHSAAIALVNGRGNWWLAEIRDPTLLGESETNLFKEECDERK